MKKFGEVLLIAGIAVFVLGLLAVGGGIIFSFRSLHTNESAGIGAVGAGIEFGLFGMIVNVLGVLMSAAGIILLLLSKRSGNS